MTFTEAYQFVEKHLPCTNGYDDSAKLCLADSSLLNKKGDNYYANKRLLRALSYAVGIIHKDYIFLKKELGV